MPVTFTAREPHYLDHLAPLWERLGGDFQVPNRIVAHAHRRGVQCVPYGHMGPRLRGTVVVASKQDHNRARGCDVIYMAHGNAQSFSGQHDGYTGGPGFTRTRLFLCPNQQAADLWAAGYDVPTAVVGCPKLDRLLKVPKPADGTVAVSFHWDARERGNDVPETWTAWPYYARALAELAKHHRVIGHGHPRIFHRLVPHYRQMGIEPVQDFEDVVRRADVYVNDCSSTLFEFAALDRPVVVLNIPAYRRDVEHGMRFWEHADIGVQCDHPMDLGDAVTEALEERGPARRREIVSVVYPHLGRSVDRALEAIELEGLCPELALPTNLA